MKDTDFNGVARDLHEAGYDISTARKFLSINVPKAIWIKNTKKLVPDPDDKTGFRFKLVPYTEQDYDQEYDENGNRR